MERTKLNYIVDVLMFIAIAATGVIGILLGFVIPTGDVPGWQKYLWGLHRHDWGGIHLYLSICLFVLFILHIILHWAWIKAITGKYLRSVSLLWAILAAPFVLLFFLWLLHPKDRPRPGHEEHAEYTTADQMTKPAAVYLPSDKNASKGRIQ